MKIFQFLKALDQWEPSLDDPDQWECSTLAHRESLLYANNAGDGSHDVFLPPVGFLPAHKLCWTHLQRSFCISAHHGWDGSSHSGCVSQLFVSSWERCFHAVQFQMSIHGKYFVAHYEAKVFSGVLALVNGVLYVVFAIFQYRTIRS